MGENFLRKRAEGFGRQMDRARQTHIQKSDLFTINKDESARREFDVLCGFKEEVGYQLPVIGDPVIVCTPANEPPFLIHGNRRIGGFIPADESYLQDFTSAHREFGGVINMKITGVSALGDLTISPVIDAP